MQKCVCLCVCEYTYLIIKKYKLDNSTPDTGVWPSMTKYRFKSIGACFIMATPSFSHGPLHPPSTQTKPVRLSALPVHTTDQLAFSWHVIQPLPHIYTFTLIYTLSFSLTNACMHVHKHIPI